MPQADCRRCIYFVPVDELDAYRREQAMILAARQGKQALGWCRAWNKPVTYYTGYCRRYRPRKPPSKTLEEYLDGRDDRKQDTHTYTPA